MKDLEKALSSPSLTREKLLELFAEEVRLSRAGIEVLVAGPDALRVLIDGEEHTAYIENLWRTCREESLESRLTVFQRHVRALIESFKVSRAAVTRENIIPIIKDYEYCAFAKKPDALLREHLVADLWIVYAADLPDSTRSLSTEEREALGIAESDLRELSIANLLRILPPIERHGEGPWYLLTAGGDYVASILLIDEVWQQFEEEIDGDIVAVVPARDVLLFTSSKSSDGLVRIRDKARDIVQGGHHTVSETLIRRTQGQWKVFE
ncbi:MAG: DUF1444 family protein [Terriglobales bacterium]